MTSREIEIIDAVGEYVDRKFGDDAYDGESYTEKVQDYYDELRTGVEDAYSDVDLLAFPCPNCCYDITYIDSQDGDLVMAGHDCSNDEYVEPYTLASIDDQAKEIYQDEMATLTLKKALGL